MASGVTVIVSGFIYDGGLAGLPYQDPSNEMQEQLLFHKSVAQRIVLTGMTLLSVGCLWKAFQWTTRIWKRRH